MCSLIERKEKRANPLYCLFFPLNLFFQTACHCQEILTLYVAHKHTHDEEEKC